MAALGIIEVKGYAAAMAAADAMLKAADVAIFKGPAAPPPPPPPPPLGPPPRGEPPYLHMDGVIGLFIRAHDVGSVKAATDAGAEAAKVHGQVVAVHVIAWPQKAAVEAMTGDNDWENSPYWGR
jgi:ethanolamine utilization protein EutM